ncbi:uncharacterized protein LOC125034228 [Penaeus chinensis]|uniref:uncharacterized protein LOC125034228 n=1 Tax=Penaeus chinensis TaxID=139456 RepID=UPI001FB60FFC|nr:uncharacterized protein LOC125034228 [Penaeus chinensis]
MCELGVGFLTSFQLKKAKPEASLEPKPQGRASRSPQALGGRKGRKAGAASVAAPSMPRARAHARRRWRREGGSNASAVSRSKSPPSTDQDGGRTFVIKVEQPQVHLLPHT